MAAIGGPTFATLRVEVADAVATITLDRPDALNALTIPMKERAAARRFRAIARDPAVRAVVLTGAGRAFCAGQDLKERLEPDAAPLAVELRERYNPIIRAMRALDQPIVGAINGVAAGAGASLAFACDIRIAAEDASFVLAFGRIGLVPGQRRDVVPAAARRRRRRRPSWRCSASRCSAADAERFGLVARVVPADDARGRGAGHRALRLAALAPRALASTKHALDAGLVDRPRRGARGRGATARASPARPPTTPRAWPRSSRSGRLGSPGSSRTALAASTVRVDVVGCLPNER